MWPENIYNLKFISTQFNKYLLNNKDMPTIVLATGVWKHKDESISSAIKIWLAIRDEFKIKNNLGFSVMSYYHKKIGLLEFF